MVSGESEIETNKGGGGSNDDERTSRNQEANGLRQNATKNKKTKDSGGKTDTDMHSCTHTHTRGDYLKYGKSDECEGTSVVSVEGGGTGSAASVCVSANSREQRSLVSTVCVCINNKIYSR